MSERVKAAIHPPMLTWARESLGMDLPEVSEKTGWSVERLQAWEFGDPEDRPSVAQVERLAALYDRPMSLLYLPAPPVEPELPPDFRFTPGVQGRIQPELRRIIRRVRGLRDSALAIAEELGELDQRFPPMELRARSNDDAEKVGLAARKWLGIPDVPHSRATDADQAFATWREAIENRGVLVFAAMDRVPVSLFRGFALAETRAPVITINNKDEKPARMFTLLHEFGHLVLGTSAVSGDLDSTLGIERDRAEVEALTEVWCNRFAGAALVPAEMLSRTPALVGVLGSLRECHDWDREEDDRLRDLARGFGVSAEVIVRRLAILGEISHQNYKDWRASWYARYPLRIRRDQEPSGGPGQSTLAPHRLGTGYLRVVFEGYWSDRVSLYDLCNLLGNLKVETARKIESRFKARLFAQTG